MGLSSVQAFAVQTEREGQMPKTRAHRKTTAGPAAPAKASRLDTASGCTARSDETDTNPFATSHLDLAQTAGFLDAAP